MKVKQSSLRELVMMKEVINKNEEKICLKEYRGMVWWMLGVHKIKIKEEKTGDKVCILCEKEMGIAHFFRECRETEEIVSKAIDKEKLNKIKKEKEIGILSELIKKNGRVRGK